MRSVPAIDATGIQAIEKIIVRCKKNGTKVIFSHVNEQPMRIFKKSGIFEELGEEAFCANIDDALAESEVLIKIDKRYLRNKYICLTYALHTIYNLYEVYHYA